MNKKNNWLAPCRYKASAKIIIAAVLLASTFGANAVRAQSAPTDPISATGNAATLSAPRVPPGPVASVLATSDPAKTERDSPFSLTLKAGFAYDSNVAISQINTSSGQSDTLANLGLSAGYKLLNKPSRSLSIGYDFSQSLHSKLSQFDIQLHSFSANGSVRAGKSQLGLTYSFNHILLAKKPFLDMQFISPSILTPITPKIFMRASYTYLDLKFLSDQRRDAKHSQPGLQAFYFFNHSRSFVLLGANYQRETTKGAEYTYRGYALSASVSMPLKLLNHTAKVRADYEWLSRNYDNVTPSIGVNRFDRASTYRLSAEIPVVSKLSLGLEAKHVSRSSNVQFANLNENAASAELIFRF